MKIAFDIGGVLSKYKSIRTLLDSLAYAHEDIYIITDMHDMEEILRQLKENKIDVDRNNVYSADYMKYGEAAKAILLRNLKIDIFFDDFIGYTYWDSAWGPAPVRCLLMPDPTQPYWSDDWKCSGADFGRRRYLREESKQIAVDIETPKCDHNFGSYYCSCGGIRCQSY